MYRRRPQRQRRRSRRRRQRGDELGPRRDAQRDGAGVQGRRKERAEIEDRVSFVLLYFEGEGRIQCAREMREGLKQAAISALSSFFRTFLRSAYSEVVDDLWHYLRDEKGIAEPQQYLCVPMRLVSQWTHVMSSNSTFAPSNPQIRWEHDGRGRRWPQW